MLNRRVESKRTLLCRRGRTCQSLLGSMQRQTMTNSFCSILNCSPVHSSPSTKGIIGMPGLSSLPVSLKRVSSSSHAKRIMLFTHPYHKPSIGSFK
jgi:hypothetical protein